MKQNSAPNLLSGIGIDMRRLAKITSRPKLFEQATNSFWTDPYVSSHVLGAHLDPMTDAASRQPHVITRSVRWIAEVVGGAGPFADAEGDRASGPARILDLGCGPGLYSTEFARLGFTVTGIDFSESSITYARREAKRDRLPITYECLDYRDLAARDAAEVATLIYGELGVFSDRDRDRILKRVHDALVSGGYFIFDIFTERYAERVALTDGWYVSLKDGFWSSRPHMVLESTYRYPEQNVNVDRYVIIDEAGTVRTYNNWKHYYNRESISRVLQDAGFEIETVWGDLCGETFDPAGEWIGIVARRR